MSSIKTTQIDGDVSVGRNVAIGGKADIAGSVSIGHNLKVDGWLEAPNIKGNDKGIFVSAEKLRAAYPSPTVGNRALVGETSPFAVWQCETAGVWADTGVTESHDIDLTDYARKDEMPQIIDSLTSDDATAALSAAQGKTLASMIDEHAVETDATLTMEGSAADAKAVGERIETLSDKFGEAALYEDNSFTESYGRGGTKTDSINNARYIGKVLDIASDYTVDRIEFDAERFASVVPQGDVTVQYGIVNGETKHLVSKSTFTVPAGQNAVDVGIAVPAHHFIVVRKTNLGVDSGGNTVKLFALSWFSGGENLAQFINGTVGETYSSVGSYILQGLTVEYSYTQRDYLKAQEVRQTARRVDELGVVEETVTPTDWQRGGINATSSDAKFGQVVTNTPTAYVCSGNIDCAGSVSVKAALPTANNATNQTLGLVFYDADGNPISGVRIKVPISGEKYNDITVDTPPDAAYLRTTYFQGGTTVTLVRRTQDAIGKLYDRAEAVRSYAHSLDHFPDNADYADKVGLLKQVAKNKKLLCWFSDLHADAVRLSRILAFCKHYGIGDILFTGDLVEINHTEDIAWWAETGAQDVLIAIGNHDVWGDGEVNVTQRAVYDKFIAPYVARWGVVQPEGAAENALCYYYKDYTANTLRLIVIDDQYKPASQTEWLTNVLADAKTQGLRVIIATHGYPEATSTGTLDTPFDTNRGTPNNWYPIPQIVSAVKTFIDGGGMFVCWLTGHAHYNYARLLDGDARQLCLSVANAGIATSVRGQGYRNTEALSQDQFDILGINDTSLFVARIGCDMEFTRGKAVTMAWNYVEHKLLY